MSLYVAARDSPPGLKAKLETTPPLTGSGASIRGSAELDSTPAVIGGDPQDLKFEGEATVCMIGSDLGRSSMLDSAVSEMGG